jgi:hypothetical protein
MLDYLEQEIPRKGNIIQNSVKGGSRPGGSLFIGTNAINKER